VKFYGQMWQLTLTVSSQCSNRVTKHETERLGSKLLTLTKLLLTANPMYYLLTPWSRVLPEKLKRRELLKKFPEFYGTRRFITAFTKARHLSLSRARLIQSMPPPSNLSQVHFNIILPPTPGSSKWSPSLRFSH
jgi:hypothetical protein